MFILTIFKKCQYVSTHILQIIVKICIVSLLLFWYVCVELDLNELFIYMVFLMLTARVFICM